MPGIGPMSVYGLSCQTGSRRLEMTGQVRSSALTMLAQIKRNDEDPQQTSGGGH